MFGNYTLADHLLGSQLLNFTSPGGEIMGKKILYIDEEYVNYLYFSELLADSGADIYRAYSWSQAKYWLDSERDFCMVLISSGFLSQNGFSVITDIKKRNSGLQVVVIMEESNPEILGKCVKAGCDLHLSRQIDAIHLVEAVNDLLSNTYHNL